MPAATSALIDVGSNAARLLVGALENGVFVKHLFIRAPVGLGRACYGGTGAAAAQKRLISALSGLRQIAEAMEARRCAAVATAAVRDSPGRRRLLENIRKQAGLTVQVLDGAEEAAIIGAFAARQFPSFRSVLNADTGGGSTDCALVIKGEVAAHATFAVGTARKNGGAAAEKNKMAAWLNNVRADAAVISGGGARKMEEICGEITEANLAKFLRRAEKTPAAKRVKMFGLTPDRARTILPAARIARLVLRACGAGKLRTIEGGLGEAVLTQMLADGGRRAPKNAARRRGG